MKTLAYVSIVLLLNFSLYAFNFPDDHTAHGNYQTEWWYYTGHFSTDSGKEFGYELTFFKVEWPQYKDQAPSDWSAKPLYLAHFAITDKDNKKFYYAEKMNRPVGDIAGANLQKYHVWNENWSVRLKEDKHYLLASAKNFAIDFTLTPTKKPIAHGDNGKSLRGLEKDNFSNYYSITRLSLVGKITIGEKSYNCNGISWMDHEWMNNRKYNDYSNLTGWDWFSIQLDNNTEIMLYLLRDSQNNIKSVSSGTLIYSNNQKKHLQMKDFHIQTLDHWTSPYSKGVYPIKWKVTIPSEKITLTISPHFNAQELDTQKSTQITYWEGACSVLGQVQSQDVSGHAYVEMTGYGKKLQSKKNK